MPQTYDDVTLVYNDATAVYNGTSVNVTPRGRPINFIKATPNTLTYDEVFLAYNGPSSYNGAAGVASNPVFNRMTWGQGTATVAAGASINPTSVAIQFRTSAPTVTGATEVIPTGARMVWNPSSPQVGQARDLALEKPWINPLRNSLQGEDAVPLNHIFDNLEAFLRAPVFPGGVIVGNGATPGARTVPPSATRIVIADIVPPSAPTGLALTGGIQSIVLKWDGNNENDLAGYDVQIDITAGFAAPIERQAGGSMSLISGLTFGTTYYGRVRAFDTSGNVSGWSSTQTGTPSQITGPDIAANSVSAAMIVAGSILTDKLAANAVTAGKIQAISITAAGIKVGEIVSGTIAADSITANMIQAGSITADKIQAGSIDATKITVGGITTATIADLAILESKIGSLAISNRTIASNAIDARTIQADSITAREIAAQSISADELSSLNIRVGQVIQSSNFSSGVSGWYIDGSGNAEFDNVTLRGSLYAGTATGAYVAIAVGDQDTVRFYTGAGDYAAINAIADRLQLVSPYGQGGNSYVELFSSNAYGGLSRINLNASTVYAFGDIEAAGSILAFSNITASAVRANVHEGLSGLGARIRCTSGNTVEFYWNGTTLQAYIDGTGPFNLN